MSEQAPPDKLVFRSDMKTVSRQTKDYFAEQNKKRAEKKAKRKKYTLLIGIPLCIVLVVSITVFLLNQSTSTPTTPEENQQTANTIYTQIMDNVSTSRPILAGTGSGVAPTTEAIAEANAAFEAEISDALEDKNAGAADAIRVAQMVFYINVGTDYAKMIEIGETVGDIDKLELEQQLQYYSIMSAAYTNQGDEEKAAFYSGKAVELISDESNSQEEGGI